MLILLLTLLSVQENSTSHNEHDHAHAEDDGFLYFQPLSAGTFLEQKNFQIMVPDGVFYANEENVPLMLPLTGAHDIPNCVGIFYSNSNNWNYSAVVQHFDDHSFNLKPEITSDVITTFFKRNHLNWLTPFNGQADVVIPPTYQREENSFTLGMQYTEEDHTLVIVKKIYATALGALVITYKGSDEAFNAEPEALNKILHSVTVNDLSSDEASSQNSLSYLQLLGFVPKSLTVAGTEIDQRIEPKYIFMSALLGLVGVTLLILAFKFRNNSGRQVKS